MDTDALFQLVSRYDARVADIRAEGREPRWNELDEWFEQNSNGISIKEARSRVGEEQRAAKYGRPDDERVDDLGGKARQFAQGLTLGFGDEIAGIIGAIGPGTYKEAQQESLAGIEEFRRKNPWEAMALEGAGSMVLPGAGGIGAARSGVGLFRGLGAASKAKRALTHGGLGLLEGAIYGAGEAGPGERLSGAAKMGSTTGGLGAVIGASPLGRMGQQAIRRRGQLLKDKPGGILKRIPDVDVPIGPKTSQRVAETSDGYIFYEAPDGRWVDDLNPDLEDLSFNSLEELQAAPIDITIETVTERAPVNLQRKARELLESRVSGGAEGPVTAQTLATHTPRSANVLSRETAEATTDLGGQPIDSGLLSTMRGLEPTDPTLPLPSTGPGRRIGTEQLDDLSGLTQRGTRQKGLLEAGLEVDRARIYRPLERIYGGAKGKSWKLTDNIVDRAVELGGDALDDIAYRSDVQKGRDLLLEVMDKLGDSGLLRGAGRTAKDKTLIREMRKALNLTERAKLKRAISTKRSALRNAKGAEKKKIASELDALDTKLTEMESVADGATLPGMKAMQRFRSAMRDAVETKEVAYNYTPDVELAMGRMFPGLDSADEVFKVSSTKSELFRAGLGEVDTVQFQKLVESAPSAGLGQKNAARNLDNLIEQARALTDDPALKDEYVKQFLDGHFMSELIEPLLSGKQAGAERAAEVYDQLMSPAGADWLRRFFASGDEGTKAWKKALSDIDQDLPLEVTMPRLADAMRWGRRLVGGALAYQGLKSIGLIGGGVGGADPR